MDDPAQDLILIGLGANLPHPRFGDAQSTLEAALQALQARGVRVAARSTWYRSAPVPPSGQPWFVNGVAAVETALPPEALLALLHEVEEEFGRVRSEPNAARVIDLDLLAYGQQVSDGGKDGQVGARKGGTNPILPHPRLEDRAFVLLPLADLAPDWRHPTSGRSVADLIRALPEDQQVERIPGAPETPASN